MGLIQFSRVSILILLVAISGWSVQTAFSALVVGQDYLIRNSADGTYLHVAEDGWCTDLSIVETTSALDSSNVTFQWRYTKQLSGDSALIMDPLDSHTEFKWNEVSLYASLYCFVTRRSYNLSEVANSTYIIQELRNPDNTPCLTGWGDGKPTTTEDCNSESSSQHWEFIHI